LDELLSGNPIILSSEISSVSQDERYFSIEENECLSKVDQKKLKKCKIGESKSKCTICLEQFKKNQVIQILPCHHKFHHKCLKPWFKTSTCCPLCRMDIKKHFNPETPSIQSQLSVQSNERNSLLDRSFIQPRTYTPGRSDFSGRRLILRKNFNIKV